MKIAIYQPRISYYVGGGEVVPLEMAKFFSRHHHNITIVTSRHPEGNSEYFDNFLKENTNIKTVYLELPEALKWIYQEKPGTSQLRWDYEAVHVGRLAQTYFEQHNFDILNVHYRVDVMAASIKYPTVMFLHGVPAETEYFDQVWYSFPNVKYVSVSKYIGEKWANMIKGLKYDVFTNGIDSTFFHPVNLNKDIDILYFGRLVPVKGINYLIDAIKILIDKKYSPKVTIAGKGNQKEELEEQVKRQGLSKYIDFVGYVPQEQILDLYNRAKLLAAPSFDREGVLTTMLEAAACAVPTVTTNSCSMPEFIDHGINGLLAVPQSAESLADEIEKLLRDSDYARKLGLQARGKAEVWDWNNKAKDLERYFESAK